jgi:hypothetical protein
MTHAFPPEARTDNVKRKVPKNSANKGRADTILLEQGKKFECLNLAW